jgi:uncharacterized protein YdgA (DUF945 family)
VNQIGERFQRFTGAAKRKARLRAPKEQKDQLAEASGKKEMVAPEVIVEEEVEEKPQVIVAIEPERQASVQQTERVEKQEESWETDIGSFHIKIAVPFDVLREAGLSTWETRTKIAGALAAQTLQKYPQLAYSPSQDQVALWSSIRKSILSAFEQHALTQ